MRRQPATGQHQLHGARLADGPRQSLRATGTGDDAQPDLGLAEDGVIGGHHHVAGQRQLEATAERVAPDRRDGRGAQTADVVPALEGSRRGQALGRGIGHLGDVRAGREGTLAGTGDDDAAAVGVGIERIQGVDQLAHRLDVERIEDLGPVDGHQRDARLDRAAGRARLHADPRPVDRATRSSPGLRVRSALLDARLDRGRGGDRGRGQPRAPRSRPSPPADARARATDSVLARSWPPRR